MTIGLNYEFLSSFFFFYFLNTIVSRNLPFTLISYKMTAPAREELSLYVITILSVCNNNLLDFVFIFMISLNLKKRLAALRLTLIKQIFPDTF